MKIMQISDLHLGSAAPSLSCWTAAEISQEMWRILLSLSQLVEQRGIDVVLLAGDILDNPRIADNWLYILTKVLKSILEKGIVVVFVNGNHDYFLSEKDFMALNTFSNFISFFEDTACVKTVDYKDKRLAFYGIAYASQQPQRDITKFPAKADADYHIAIAHGEVDNASNSSAYYNFDSKAFQEYDVFAIGHRHRHQIIADKILYAGSVMPINKNNHGKKGVLFYDLADIKNSLELYSLSKFELTAISLHLSADDTAELISELVKKLDAVNRGDRVLVLDLLITMNADYRQIELAVEQALELYPLIILGELKQEVIVEINAEDREFLQNIFAEASKSLEYEKGHYFDKGYLLDYLETNQTELIEQLWGRIANYENKTIRN